MFAVTMNTIYSRQTVQPLQAKKVIAPAHSVEGI
jgi:hypothetical protein